MQSPILPRTDPCNLALCRHGETWGRGGSAVRTHMPAYFERSGFQKSNFEILASSSHRLQICLFITEIYLSIKYVLYQIIHFAQAGKTCRHSFSKQVGLWPTGVSLGHVYCERTGSAERNAQVPPKEDACTCHACTHRTYGPFTIPFFPKLHIKSKKDRAFKSVSTMLQVASKGFSKANPKVPAAFQPWPLDGQSFFSFNRLRCVSRGWSAPTWVEPRFKQFGVAVRGGGGGIENNNNPGTQVQNPGLTQEGTRVRTQVQPRFEPSSTQGLTRFEPGLRPGFEPGFKPGFEPGFKPGFRTWVPNLGSEPGFKPGFEPGFEPGFKPGF